MNPVLAIDASSFTGGVALSWSGGLAVRELPGQRRHAEAIIPLALELMTEAGAVWSALAGIGVATGPGSFTGIRVGLAAAQGLAAAHDLPVAGVGSLDVLARACLGACRPPADSRVVAVQDVRRGEVAVRGFRVTAAGGLEGETELELVSLEGPALAAMVAGHRGRGWLVGDPGLTLPALDGFRHYAPDGEARARALVEAASEQLAAGSPPHAEPLYARPANAVPRRPGP